MTTRTDPIILLHGWGFTPAVWTPMMDALTQRGFNREGLSAPALPLASGDLSQTIQALIPLLPTRAHVVGWSLGGELALALTNHAPERVASLTLVASTPCFMNRADWSLGQPESLLDDFVQRLADNPASLLKRFSTLIRHGDAIAGRDRNLAERLAQTQESDPAKLAGGLRLLRDIDLRTRASATAAATQLIHGAADAVVSVAAAEWLAQRLGAPLHPYENASHALPLTHTEQIADQLHRFIGQHA